MALLIPLGLVSVLAAVWLMGWSFLRLLAVLFLVWLIVLVMFLAAPAAEVRSLGAFSLKSWLVSGIILFIVLGYAGIVRAIRARATELWGDPQEHGKHAPVAFAAVEQPATDPEVLERYARHIVLREIGGPGQAKLRKASVLIVGAGGLGAPAALYLAGAGVGRIGLVDPDTVSLSNLQRQIIYRTSDAGRPKGLAAAEALRALNPLIDVQAMRYRVTAEDLDLLADYDLVLDGTDSFEDRAAINAACVAAGVPLIAGSISQWEGQLSSYDPASGGPCFACIFPDAPAPGLALPCAEAGVVGPLPGVIGSMMALEAIKQITGAGRDMKGQMLVYDGLYGETRTIRMARRPDCPICSGLGTVAPEA